MFHQNLKFINYLVIFFICASSSLFAQDINNPIFPLMKETLLSKPVKIESLHMGKIFRKKNITKFRIRMDKTPFNFKGRNYNKVFFGNDSNEEYINMIVDTLFISHENFIRLKCEDDKRYLVLNSSNIGKDTTYLKSFGSMGLQKIWLDKVIFSQKINDSLFVFKLRFSREGIMGCSTAPLSHSQILYDFESIILSKKYGFVEVVYRDSGYKVTYRYLKY